MKKYVILLSGLLVSGTSFAQTSQATCNKEDKSGCFIHPAIMPTQEELDKQPYITQKNLAEAGAIQKQTHSTTIDMTKVLVNEKGKPIKDATDRAADDPTCAKCGDLTIGIAVEMVLNAVYPDEIDLSLGQRIARALVAERVRDNTQATLNVQEIATIEKLLPKAAKNSPGFTNLVMMQIMRSVDPTIEYEKIKP